MELDKSTKSIFKKELSENITCSQNVLITKLFKNLFRSIWVFTIALSLSNGHGVLNCNLGKAPETGNLSNTDDSMLRQ